MDLIQVTDPSLLKRLEEPEEIYTPDDGLAEVTDPNILKMLETDGPLPIPSPQRPARLSPSVETYVAEQERKLKKLGLPLTGSEDPAFLDAHARKPKPVDMGDLGNEFLRSVGQQNFDLYAEALMIQHDLTGDPQAKDFADLLKRTAKSMEGGVAPRKAKQNLTDVRSIQEAIDWAQASMGQGVGSTMGPLVGGGMGYFGGKKVGGKVGGKLGAGVGALLGSAPLSLGEMRKALLEEGVEDPKLRAEWAIKGGLAMAALDSALPASLASKIMSGGTRKAIQRGIVKRIMQGGARSATVEGGTEGTQASIEYLVKKHASGNPVSPEEWAHAAFNEGAAGAVGGAGMGAVTGAVPDQPTETAVQPPQPSPEPPLTIPPDAETAAPPPASTLTLEQQLSILEQQGYTNEQLLEMDDAERASEAQAGFDAGIQPYEDLPSGDSETAPIEAEALTPVAPPPPEETPQVPLSESALATPPQETSADGRPSHSESRTDIGEGQPASPQPDSLIGVPSENVSLVEPPSLEGMINRSVGDAQAPRDGLSIDTILGEPYSEINVPTRRSSVEARVFRPIRDRKVFRAVVSSIPVDVMNNLGGEKFSAKDLGRNSAMFVRAFRANRNLLVRRDVLDAIIRSPAFPIAEVFPEYEARGTLDGVPAAQASNFDSHAPIGTTDSPKVKQKRAKPPQGFIKWIIAQGGMRDDTGELRAMDLHKIPGFVREKGKSADEIRELAVGAGYLVDSGRDFGGEAQTTKQDVYDAIAEERSGIKRYPVRDRQEAIASEIKAQAALGPEAPPEAEALGPQLWSFFQSQPDLGPDDYTSDILAKAKAILEVDPTIDAASAIEAAVMTIEEGLVATQVPSDDLPFFPDAPTIEDTDESAGTLSEAEPAVPGGSDQGAPSEVQADRQEAGEELPRSRQDEPRPEQTAEAVTTEVTEAGTQTVLPGAEKITEAEQAQRQADKPLRAKAPQKSADEGLFSDDAKQTDLIDRLRKPDVLTRQEPPKTGNLYQFVITDEQREHLKSRVNVIAKRIMGRTLPNIEFYDTLPGGFEGAFLADEWLIYLALQAKTDPRLVLRHEAVHVLKNTGLFTDGEWRVLSRLAERKWIDQFQIRKRYEHYDKGRDNFEALMIEEAIADAFLYYSANGPQKNAADRIFEKLKRLLEAIRNMLKGEGFTSVNSIFDKIESGKVAKRAEKRSRLFRPKTKMAQEVLTMAPPVEQFDPPVDGSIKDLANNNLPLMGRISSAARASFLETRRKMQDRFIDLKRYQDAIVAFRGHPLPEAQDVYQKETLYSGRTGQRLEDLRVDHVEPIVNEIAERGLTMEEVWEFLIANHARERNEHIASINPDMPDGGIGITTAQAEETKQRFAREGKLADLEAVSNLVYRMNRESLRRLKEAGLIAPEEYDILTARWRYYVPARGYELEDSREGEPERLRTGQRYDVRGKEFNMALGRSSAADNPLLYSIAQAEQSIIRSEKNRVGKALLLLAQNNPNPEVWEINKREAKRVIDRETGLVREVMQANFQLKDNVFATKVGGQTYYITLHHKGLARAMKGLGTDSMNGLVRGMATITRALAMVNTQLDPEFVFRNLLRDIQTATINIQEVKSIAANIVRDIPKAMKGVWQGQKGNLTSEEAQWYREFADAGGKMTFFALKDIEQQRRQLQGMLKDAGPEDPARLPLKAVKGLFNFISDANNAVENATRLAAYMNLRRAGFSQDKAGAVAKELTVNFSRKGEWGAAMNAFYLFYNASIQGQVRLVQAVYRSPKVKAIVAGIVGFSFMLDMLNRFMADDDDDKRNLYDKIPDHVKERNLIIMAPSWWPEKYKPEGGYFHTPLPLGYNIFSVIGTQIGHAWAGARKPGVAAANIGSAALSSFNPLGTASTFTSILSPSLIDPLVDLESNKDWLGRPIMPEDRYGEVTPDSQKAWRTTNPLWKLVAEKLNQATGGNEIRPGKIDISPESLEHLWTFATGGVGRLASRTYRIATSDQPLEVDQIPFARVFVGSKSKQVDREIYYEIVDSVELTVKELKARKQSGDKAAADELRRRYAPDLEIAPLIKSSENTLRQLRKQKRAVEASKATNKKQRLKAIDDRIDAVMTKVRARWLDLHKGE